MKKNYIFPIFFISFLLPLTSVSAQGNDLFDIFRNGSVDMIEEVVKDDPDFIHRKNKDGYSPLILACYSGNIEVVRYLVEHSKNLNGGSKYGTPLMAASVKGYEKIVALLLEKGVDVNASDPNGTTALHYAIIFNFDNVAKQLAIAKANANLKDNRGKTAIDYAKMLGKNELLTLLTQK